MNMMQLIVLLLIELSAVGFGIEFERRYRTSRWPIYAFVVAIVVLIHELPSYGRSTFGMLDEFVSILVCIVLGTVTFFFSAMAFCAWRRLKSVRNATPEGRR